jgi:hypothetical protein
MFSIRRRSIQYCTVHDNMAATRNMTCHKINGKANNRTAERFGSSTRNASLSIINGTTKSMCETERERSQKITFFDDNNNNNEEDEDDNDNDNDNDNEDEDEDEDEDEHTQSNTNTS